MSLDAIDLARIAIGPVPDYDVAPETLRQRAGLGRIEFPGGTRRRSREHQLAAVRNRDHPLIEARSARDDFAEAAETLGRMRTPHRSDRVVQVISRHPFSHQLTLCADGLAAAFGAMRAPEVERRARRAQF